MTIQPVQPGASRRREFLPDFLTVDEVAEYLSLSKAAVYSLRSHRRNAPPGRPIGKKLYFEREAFLAWVDSQMDGGR